MRAIPFILPILLAASVGSAQSKDLSELVAGDQPRLASVLGPHSYVPLQIRKLAHGQVLYVDLDWLREKGYEVPPAGLTPAFEKKILAVLGWAAPAEGEPASTYDNETAVAFADRYGGFGIGLPGEQNGGSGRAASRGVLQCKGCGRTELVHPSIDVYHSSGTATLEEGVAEVVASQLAHRELPYGANRVVALISVGTFTSKDGGQSNEPRILIFREDPLRPAHFMVNETAARTNTEKERMAWMTKQLLAQLPQKPDAHFATAAERLDAGFREMIERTADVLAFSYSRGLHHGAITPSNIELDGKAIDFGTFTQYQGYPKGVSVDWIGPFGDNTSVHWFLNDFVRDISPLLSGDLRDGLMSAEEANKLFDDRYAQRLNIHMSSLAGFPPEFLAGSQKTIIADLGEVLLEVALAGNDKVIKTLWNDPGKTGTYDIPQILNAMAEASLRAPNLPKAQSLDDAAGEAGILDSNLRARLVKAYLRVMKSVEQTAGLQSIEINSIKSYMVLASKIQNHKSDELSRSRKFWAVYESLFDQFKRDGRPELIRAKILEQIRTGRRSYRDAKPMTLVLSEKSASDSARIREVFDLRTGRITLVRQSVSRNEQISAAKRPVSNLHGLRCDQIFVGP